MKPFLSIIIISWNTRDLLAQCLDSVYTHRPTGQFEVIVVDNASTDGSPKMVKTQFPQVHIIENSQNFGFARANNQAIRNSQGQHILLLNSDTIVTPGALQILLDCLQTHPQAGACGPMLINADATFQASFNDFPSLLTESIYLLGLAPRLLSRRFPSHDLADSRQLRPVDWIGGACLLVRRACIEKVGLLDESFLMYSEEVDWCYRIVQDGWSIWYCPDTQIVHLGGRSANQRPEWKYIQLQKGRIQFFSKHYGQVHTSTLKGLIRLTNLVKAILFFFVWLANYPTQDHAHPRWQVYWSAVKAL